MESGKENTPNTGKSGRSLAVRENRIERVMKGEGAGGIDVKLEQASKHRHHQGGIATAWVTLSVSLHTAQRGWPVGGWVARQFLAARTVWQPACLPLTINKLFS